MLYNAAFAFLYPSLRESFGIPMIEAMACGTPIIIGNTSAMPEVAGAEALMVDPHEPEKIADALLKLETENVLYQKTSKLRANAGAAIFMGEYSQRVSSTVP